MTVAQAIRSAAELMEITDSTHGYLRGREIERAFRAIVGCGDIAWEQVVAKARG